MNPKDVVQLAKEKGVKIISFLYCDNGGVIRGKSSHISNFEHTIHSGLGMSVAMPAMSSLDTLQDIDGMGAIGEFRLVPDPNTFKILPYAPKWATIMCNMYTLDEQVWSACTRNFLQRMLHKATERGLYIKAVFEPEWTLASKDNEGNYVPSDDSLCYSSIGMTVPRQVIEDIAITLEDQDIHIEQYYPELGPGQQELSIRYDNALKAADNHIVYRETVRNVAWKHGYIASFAPKPFLDRAGNGCHIHLSVWDSTDSKNLFYSSKDKLKLSELAYQFIAGLLTHMPGLVALTCPSVNSYRRLKPRAWSSAFVCYGPDNREAAIRIPSPFWGRESSTVNIELKASDSSANPYIALGGVIAAGLAGLEEKLILDEDLFLNIDPATIPDEERNRRGILRLPKNLSEAVLALEKDNVLKQALGPELLRSYLAVRRGEIEYFNDKDEAFEVHNHFYKY